MILGEIHSTTHIFMWHILLSNQMDYIRENRKPKMDFNHFPQMGHAGKRVRTEMEKEVR